eukprot:TRINITY_DN3013_c0_g1_i3.p1 TRINITY_DN3013_c0_g1~~TRINITY_DN3013_c0_g1_i3.p1  ORF type:complete len:578 (-),score=103.10 TRINITY_DN3013_c0_g1_i3:1066-2799(-)
MGGNGPAGRGAAARPQLQHLLLTDLPEELLHLIAGHCLAGDHPAAVGLMGSCRLLRKVCYGAVRCVTVSGVESTRFFNWDSSPAVEPLVDTQAMQLLHQGMAVQNKLSSIQPLLSHAASVDAIDLEACHGDDAYATPQGEVDADGADLLFFDLLLSEVEHFHLSSLSVSGVAVKLLGGRSLSAVPLRYLRLGWVKPIWGTAVQGVLERYGATLHELVLESSEDAGTTEQRSCQLQELGRWFRTAGMLPLLKTLTLDVTVDVAAARAVVRCCPALSKLSLRSLVLTGVGNAWRWPRLPALTHLLWHNLYACDRAFVAFKQTVLMELPPMLAGRTLTELQLPCVIRDFSQPQPFPPLLVQALQACAALPPTLDLTECGTFDDTGLWELCRAPPMAGVVAADGSASNPADAQPGDRRGAIQARPHMIATDHVRDLSLLICDSVSPAGLGHLNRLASLSGLSVSFIGKPSSESILACLGGWPVERLTRLTVKVRHRRSTTRLCHGLAESGSRTSLQWLTAAGEELMEAEVAASLAALSSLTHFTYDLRCSPRSTISVVAARGRMASWFRRRLPAVRLWLRE